MASKPAKGRIGLGFKADGAHAIDYYRPSILECAADIAKAECLAGTKAVPWEVSIPIPSGMVFRKAKNQLLLGLGEKFSMRFRRAYGYVGGISYIQEGQKIPITVRAPARIQAVVKLWWMYGPMNEERHDSCCFVRLVAFTGTAAFDAESAVLTVGDPVTGLIEASRSDRDTARLSVWEPIPAVEWELRPPRTFPEDGFELNGDAIAALPALAKDNFAHFRAPNVPFARMYGFWGPKYLGPYFMAPAVAAMRSRSAGRDRARSSTPKNSLGLRLRERYYAKIAKKKADLLAETAKTHRAPRVKAHPPCFLPIFPGDRYLVEVVKIEFPRHTFCGARF